MRTQFNFILKSICRCTILIWVLYSGSLSSQAFALNNRCSEPVFGVSNISIDQRAETAAIARDIGVRRAAEQAFLMVLDRLLLPNEKKDVFVRSHDLDDFSDFTHIVEENSLDQRYIATLDFCFDATRLRKAMINADLSWSELQSPPILVIPVWKGPEGARVWHQGNEWLSEWWHEINEYDGLLSFRLLERNLINERQFRGEDFTLANGLKLSRAASLVNADQVMVVVASLDYKGSDPLVNVTARIFDENVRMITDILSDDQVVVRDSRGQNLGFVRSKIISKIETSWHMANLIDDSTANYLTVFLPVKSIKDWANRLHALDQIAIVQNYRILSLNTQGGRITMRFAGSRQALKNALAAHRLQLIDKNDEGAISIEPSNG